MEQHDSSPENIDHEAVEPVEAPAVESEAIDHDLEITDLISEEENSVSFFKRPAAILSAVVVFLVALGLVLAFTVFKSAPVEAHVGKDVVTVKAVTESVNAIMAERKGVDTTGMQIATGKDLQLAELNFHLISYLLADTGAEQNITVTDAAVATRKASIISQVGSAAKLPQALVAANIASKDLDLYIRSLLYDEQLATIIEKSGISQANAGTALEQKVAAVALKIGVKVDPKYGVWDATQAIVTAPVATK
jgi:hypothetical protein